MQLDWHCRSSVQLDFKTNNWQNGRISHFQTALGNRESWVEPDEIYKSRLRCLNFRLYAEIQRFTYLSEILGQRIHNSSCGQSL